MINSLWTDIENAIPNQFKFIQRINSTLPKEFVKIEKIEVPELSDLMVTYFSSILEKHDISLDLTNSGIYVVIHPSSVNYSGRSITRCYKKRGNLIALLAITLDIDPRTSGLSSTTFESLFHELIHTEQFVKFLISKPPEFFDTLLPGQVLGMSSLVNTAIDKEKTIVNSHKELDAYANQVAYSLYRKFKVRLSIMTDAEKKDFLRRVSFNFFNYLDSETFQELYNSLGIAKDKKKFQILVMKQLESLFAL